MIPAGVLLASTAVDAVTITVFAKGRAICDDGTVGPPVVMDFTGAP